MSGDAIVDEHPGPEFLDPLEVRFGRSAPEALCNAARVVEFAAGLLGLSQAELAILRRGLLGYHLLFGETVLELAGAPLVSLQDAARLQMLALVHWRSVDALLDADSLQLSAHRHRELAIASSCYIRDRARALGINWDGEAGRRYLAFHRRVCGRNLGDAPAGRAILEAFVEEQFVTEPDVRISFLQFVPRYVLRVGDEELCWYRFYTAVISLDDDLDDALADAVAGRTTPTVRFLTRVGALGVGRAGAFVRYHRFLRSFLVRQLDLCIKLAENRGWLAGSVSLAAVREAVQLKSELAAPVVVGRD